MDGAHPHLLFNHFPIIGSILSAIILIAGILLKNETVKKTALGLAAFTAIMTIPAFLTGEGAEEALEAINQAPDAIIHEHEELGETALWTTLVVGAISLFSLFRLNSSIGKKLVTASLVLMIANSIFLAKVGNEGGMIRHTEIRPGGVTDTQPMEAGDED